jgi:apolipoprotein D and lipocalin family protein
MQLKAVLIYLILIPIFSLSSIAPQTVSRVDLQKYSGLWSEIARMPNSFQKNCTKNVTAEYNLLDNGTIQVINRCEKNNGSIVTAKGIAKTADESTNSKLKVSFVNLLGIRLFWGNYWIIGLDPEYQWAIVGDPSRKYGWILSRTPELKESELTEIKEILKVNGYSFSSFIMTKQVGWD